MGNDVEMHAAGWPTIDSWLDCFLPPWELKINSYETEKNSFAFFSAWDWLGIRKT